MLGECKMMTCLAHLPHIRRTSVARLPHICHTSAAYLPQENLRKMQRADLSKILDVATGTGQSSVRLGADVWQPASTGKVILCAAFYTDNLKERKVLVDVNNPGQLPGVEVQLGSLTEEDFMWVLEMGRTIPTLKAGHNYYTRLLCCMDLLCSLTADHPHRAQGGALRAIRLSNPDCNRMQFRL